MSKKKQPRNGFYYYMLDMQQDLREQGRFVSIRDMPVLAGPKWSKLPDVEKQAFTIRAKQEKASPNGPPVSYRQGRMDCRGELLSERRDLALEAEVRKRREKEQLHTLLSGIDVTKRVLFFIDILSLCELKDHSSARFLPCELAMVRYSLTTGVVSSMHKFPDPGPIPMGYRFLAQSESSQSHDIPIGFDLADPDYRLVMRALEEFVDMTKDHQQPLLFAKAESVDRVEWCLQWLADKAGVTNRFTLVYEVDMLMTELASQCSTTLTPYQAHDMLVTSSYDYEQGTRCLWHEQREIKVCSLAAVNIYSYILSDYLCPLFNLPLTSNHLPQQEQQQHIPVLRSSAAAAPPPRSPGAAGLARGYRHPGISPIRMAGGGRGLGGAMGRGIGRGTPWPAEAGMGRGRPGTQKI